jgi:hypothetical protein
MVEFATPYDFLIGGVDQGPRVLVLLDGMESVATREVISNDRTRHSILFHLSERSMVPALLSSTGLR